MLKPTASPPDFHKGPQDPDDWFRSQFALMSRRRMLGAGLALGGAAIAGLSSPAWAQKAARKMTPLQTVGPFYPVEVGTDVDADLTQIAGHKAAAKGPVLYVSGKVLDLQGKPVAKATLDIWQANAAGRYAHPGDTNKAPLDPDFQGFARLITDAEGNYSFKTIKPGAYPTGVGDWTRPPHIHFDVKGRFSRSITQMYFEGEALNAKDRLLNEVGNAKDTLVAKYAAPSGKQEKDSLVAQWDIVLLAG